MNEQTERAINKLAAKIKNAPNKAMREKAVAAVNNKYVASKAQELVKAWNNGRYIDAAQLDAEDHDVE